MPAPTQGWGNVLFAGFVALGLAFVAVFDLLPLQREVTKLRTSCENLAADLKIKQIYFEEYAELQAKVVAPSGGVSAPARERLKTEEVGELHNAVRATAVEHSLEVDDIVLGLDTDELEYTRLSVDVQLVGAVPSLHGYLLELLQHPAFDHLESVRISRTPYGRLFSVKLWLGVE